MAVLHTVKAWLYENLLTEDRNDLSARGGADINAADIVENVNAHLLIVVPALEAGTYRLEITTRFTGSGGKTLKAPRTAVFDRLLTVA